MSKTISNVLVRCFVLAALFFPVVSMAETVFREGGTITLDQSQSIAGDYYSFAGLLNKSSISGVIDEDLYTYGLSVMVNGEVGNDVAILAGTAQVNAPVADDVRVVGGEVVVSSDVGGDLVVLAGTLEILSTASIAGNVYFYGGDLTVSGPVGGAVNGKAERARLDAKIDGDVHLRAPAGLTLGEEAAIAGSLQYASVVPLVRAPQSTVEGDISELASPTIDPKEAWRTALTPLFVVLFAALSLFLLFKKDLLAITALAESQYFKNLAIGAGLLLAGPLVTLLLISTVLGSLLGFMTGGFIMIIYAVSLALTGTMFGFFVAKLSGLTTESTLLTVLLGTTALYGLLYVPILGVVLYTVLFLLTLGIVCRYIIGRFTH